MSALSRMEIDLEKASAEERVAWAVETFGDELIMTTSFGTHSAIMLHLVTRIVPDIPVVFVDTGYLFPEIAGVVLRTVLCIYINYF